MTQPTVHESCWARGHSPLTLPLLCVDRRLTLQSEARATLAASSLTSCVSASCCWLAEERLADGCVKRLGYASDLLHCAAGLPHQLLQAGLPACGSGSAAGTQDVNPSLSIACLHANMSRYMQLTAISLSTRAAGVQHTVHQPEDEHTPDSPVEEQFRLT